MAPQIDCLLLVAAGLVLFSASSSPAPMPSSGDPPVPTGLLTNLLTNPQKTVLTDPAPSFGWIVPTTRQGDVQTAFRILVASDREQLLEGRADMWDSGEVKTSRSLHVKYAGRPLSPDSSYWWTVRTWNADGRPTGYARPQQFHTGNFDRSGEKWPGESKWIRLPDESGEQRWTFEDRHPIAYHPQAPQRIVTRGDGVTFVDFGRAAFSSLRLELAWNPPPGEPQETRIEIAVGEKSKGDGLDPQPGGGVIYRKYPLTIRSGTHSYAIEFPRFVPKYPHSQPMPAHMPEVVPFRYCEVLPGKEAVGVKSAAQLALWSEFDDQAAAFHSSSPALDAVYDLCRYSLKVNTFNGDYASSERERMMYEADTHIQQMGHYAVDREFAIARYSAANMLHHASWPTEWISHNLFMAWADYLHTGDKSFLVRHYDTLKPKTLTALAGPDGLISTRTGLQTPEFLKSIHGVPLKDIVDWPTTEADGYEFREYNTVVNAFYYRSLVLMAEIARVVGRDDDAEEYSDRAENVRTAFRKAFFDPVRGLYTDGIGSTKTSFHANLFPLAFGLVPEEFRPGVIAHIKSRNMACGVYPAQYLLEALYDNDEPDAGFALLTSESDRGWLNMIRMGSTVTTEAWDMKYKQNIGWTHAWSASPAHIIPRKIMGIEPLEPGFGKVRIRPQLGPLTEASVKLPTIRGDILLQVVNRPQEPYRLDLTLPANVTGEIVLPAFGGEDAKVTVDGKPVEVRREGNRLVLPPVGSGRHEVVAGR
jgi:hypothetical protein